MMTCPPCYNDGKDCSRRYIGCSADCEAWHKWLVIHADEKERFHKDLNKDGEAYKFMEGHDRRMQADRTRRCARKRKL